MQNSLLRSEACFVRFSLSISEPWPPVNSLLCRASRHFFLVSGGCRKPLDWCNLVFSTLPQSAGNPEAGSQQATEQKKASKVRRWTVKRRHRPPGLACAPAPANLSKSDRFCGFLVFFSSALRRFASLKRAAQVCRLAASGLQIVCRAMHGPGGGLGDGPCQQSQGREAWLDIHVIYSC